MSTYANVVGQERVARLCPHVIAPPGNRPSTTARPRVVTVREAELWARWAFIDARPCAICSPDDEERVVRLKDRSGLSWPELAAAFGVTKRAVLHWKAGGTMSPAHRKRLSDLLTELHKLDQGSPAQTRAALMTLGPDGEAPYQRWVRQPQRHDPTSSWISRQPGYDEEGDR